MPEMVPEGQEMVSTSFSSTSPQPGGGCRQNQGGPMFDEPLPSLHLPAELTAQFQDERMLPMGITSVASTHSSFLQMELPLP